MAVLEALSWTEVQVHRDLLFLHINDGEEEPADLLTSVTFSGCDREELRLECGVSEPQVVLELRELQVIHSVCLQVDLVLAGTNRRRAAASSAAAALVVSVQAAVPVMDHFQTGTLSVIAVADGS